MKRTGQRFALGQPGGVLVRPINAAVFELWFSTRSQIAKMDAVAAGLADPIPSAQQTFADVLPASPFWNWIEDLAGRGILSGYTCGGPGEPCDAQGRPYFHPGPGATRGQIAKIVYSALATLPAQR